MSDSAPKPERKTLVQYVTRIFVREPEEAESPVVAEPEKPAESAEKAAERLAAYQKLCAQEAENNPANGDVAKKKMKYRASDFNGSGQHPKVKVD